VDPQISLVTLGVSDLAQSLRFYRNGLGLPLQDRDEDSDIAFFPFEGTWLELYTRELLGEDATIDGDGSGFSGSTIAHNGTTNAEGDTVPDEAEAAGGRIVKPGQETFWGGYFRAFADPDGHLWEMAYPLLTDI
jgi:catechol 2,3-dioxygenase-like lactoylglutathione lyase family enzyme